MFLFLLLIIFFIMIIAAKSKANEVKKFEEENGITVNTLEDYEIKKEAIKQAKIELEKEKYKKNAK